MTINLLLVCRDPEAREEIILYLRKQKVEVDAIASLADHFNVCEQLGQRKPYHGILLDISTKILSLRDPNEEAHVQELLKRHHILHVTWNKNSRTVQFLLHRGSESDNKIKLEQFLESCANRTPQIIRCSPRYPLHLSTRICRPDEDPEGGEKSVTFTVSQGGLFLYSTQHWHREDHLLLHISDLPGPTIQGEVRWVVRWGSGRQLPGIGITFTHISAQQLERLQELSMAGMGKSS